MMPAQGGYAEASAELARWRDIAAAKDAELVSVRDELRICRDNASKWEQVARNCGTVLELEHGDHVTFSHQCEAHGLGGFR